MEGALAEEKGLERRSLADKAIQPVLPNPLDRSLFLTNLMIDENKVREKLNALK